MLPTVLELAILALKINLWCLKFVIIFRTSMNKKNVMVNSVSFPEQRLQYIHKYCTDQQQADSLHKFNILRNIGGMIVPYSPKLCILVSSNCNAANRSIKGDKKLCHIRLLEIKTRKRRLKKINLLVFWWQLNGFPLEMHLTILY